MNTRLHFSSKSAEWETPRYLFNQLNKVYHFTLDPAATHENHLCEKYFTQDDDGLTQDWSQDIVFLNPPYGRVIKHWMKKAYEESLKGAIIICLIPSRTDTAWWHDYVMKGDITFLRGRLKFQNRQLPNYQEDGNFKITSAPFPTAIVKFAPKLIAFSSGKRT